VWGWCVGVVCEGGVWGGSRTPLKSYTYVTWHASCDAVRLPTHFSVSFVAWAAMVGGGGTHATAPATSPDLAA
jgi:hypothetical protein